ncbi:MAG: comM protein, partial [Caulobacteraceae bacterium]|nr:comM protein [Caulobacteraceae bacterium]
LDRIDLQIEVPPVTAADLALPPPAEGSAEAAARVAEARGMQTERAAAAGGGAPELNARAEGEFLERIAAMDDPARALLAKAAQGAALTARGWTRTIRLARTIADLDGSDAVRRIHIAEALIYRRVAAATDSLAATIQA